MTSEAVMRAVSASSQTAEALAKEGFSLRHIPRAAVTILVCVLVIRILSRLINKLLRRSRLEHAMASFLASACKALLWVIAALIVLSSLNVDVTSLIALLSVAGLAVSLALQDSLSNLAGGVLLLATKPFVSGDYVESGSSAGSVQEIGLIYTTLLTFDGKVIHIPNSEISGARIINYNGSPTRRIDISFPAPYRAPVETVQSAIMELLAADSRIRDDPAPSVHVSAYKGSQVEYTIRAWCGTAEYWDVYYGLMDRIKTAADAAGAGLPCEHVNVHILEK